MARRRRAGGRARGAELRRPVRWTPVIGLSILLLTGGWTLLWVFARAEALSTFEQWRASERVFGRIWTCPGQRVGGFPLGIELTCDRPTFEGPVANGVIAGNIDRLVAAAQLYFPTRIVVTPTGPLRVTDVATGQRVEASWTAATLTLRGAVPDGLDRGLLEASGLRVVDDAQPQQSVLVERVALSFKPMPRLADARSDLEATIEAEDMRIPLLDARLGTAEPLTLRASGFATQVRFDGSATAGDVLGPWSRAGGQVHLQSFTADKGPTRITASGRFGLDEEHRPEGRIEAGFSGVGPIAERLGLPLGMVQIGGALASLLGGKPAAPTTHDDINVPIIAKDGALFVGPVRTGVRLTPVY